MGVVLLDLLGVRLERRPVRMGAPRRERLTIAEGEKRPAPGHSGPPGSSLSLQSISVAEPGPMFTTRGNITTGPADVGMSFGNTCAPRAFPISFTVALVCHE